jgi:hypothetical protein
MKTNGNTRVQLEFTESWMNRLRDLKARTEAPSYAEVVRQALKEYEIILNKRKS